MSVCPWCLSLTRTHRSPPPDGCQEALTLTTHRTTSCAFWFLWGCPPTSSNTSLSCAFPPPDLAFAPTLCANPGFTIYNTHTIQPPPPPPPPFPRSPSPPVSRLGNPAGINGPPLPIPTLGTIALEAPLLLIDPLFWVTLYSCRVLDSDHFDHLSRRSQPPRRPSHVGLPCCF